MKCPHCNTSYHDYEKTVYVNSDSEGAWGIAHTSCSGCDKVIMKVIKHNSYQRTWSGARAVEYTVRPQNSSREPVSEEVPNSFKEDYLEASMVIDYSPKASAALSRRCLQHILREKAGIKKGSLANEIQQVLDDNKLPSHLSESLDAIRNIGNFSAHPIKSYSTGEIINVELGEAEWNLDVIESLFDFYFVQPEIIRKKREALNLKLADAGKPELK